MNEKQGKIIFISLILIASLTISIAILYDNYSSQQEEVVSRLQPSIDHLSF